MLPTALRIAGRLAAVPAAVLLATALGCARPAAVRAPVVLISIDTLRSDRLPAYGFAGVETPAIDALRRDAVLYARAYSDYPLTLPAHVSLLSGRLAGAHGVRDNSGYRVGDTLAPWLPALLGEAGYATGGFVSSFVLRRETGFGRGFGRFDDDVRPRPDLPAGGIDRPGRETSSAARAWLREVAGRPFFLFLHLYEPHLPYTAPEPFRSRYPADPYAAEIAEADQVVGELLGELRALGLYDRALVALVSDHGEGFGEHGEDEHGVLLYREALQVPLLLKLPGNARAGETVDAPAQLVDLVPTLAGLLGLPPASPPLPGSSLLALPAARALYAETYHGWLNYGWSPLAGVVSGRHHYIDSPAPELYDLLADPAETINLVATERRLAGELRRQLEPHRLPLVPPAAEDAATRERLAALGYLSTGAAVAGLDPAQAPAARERVGAIRRLGLASEQLRQGRADDAIATLREVLAANPRMVEGWTTLGSAFAVRGRWQEALAAFERCFELAQRDPNRAPGVARALLELGRVREAVELMHWSVGAGLADGVNLARLARRLVVLEHAAEAEALLRAAADGRAAPPARAALAELLAGSGRAAEALTFAESAVALEPRDPFAAEQLAFALLASERFEAAAAAAQRAVALDPKRANAWNHLGVALYRSGRRDEALAAWERAVAEAPDLFDTLFNLGLAAAELGRRELAVRTLRDFLARAPAARYERDFPRVRAVLAALEKAAA